MASIIINEPAEPTVVFKYGPYDVTDYATWQAALDAGVQAGSSIQVIRYNTKVIFLEIR